MAALPDNMRDRFHLPAAPYFLSHSVGLMPKGAMEAIESSVFAPWQAQGQSWEEWLEAIEQFRAAIARLVNTTTDMVCPQMNLSSALTKILFSLPKPDRFPVLLMSEQDFPTIGFVAQQATRLGWKLKFLPKEADHSDASIWDEAMGPDVGLLIATHVYSNSSTRAPIADITRLAYEKGITCIIDVAQSAGCLPIDQEEWQAAFIIGSCVKYLCGGPGAGWLAVHPDMITKCRPLDVGWFSHENPFEFDLKQFRYAPDASRFWGGTPSVLPFAMAARSISTLNDIGIGNITAHNQAMLGLLIAGLDPGSILSETRPGRRGSHLLYRPADPEAAAGRLQAAGIAHDSREGALRLSIHLYNTASDIDAALAALNG